MGILLSHEPSVWRVWRITSSIPFNPFNPIRHTPTTTDDARCGDARDGAFVDVAM